MQALPRLGPRSVNLPVFHQPERLPDICSHPDIPRYKTNALFTSQTV
jgi:hypothetical protein